MAEPMTVVVEAWPVAADETGIWLLSGVGPWWEGPVPADGEPHDELRMLLFRERALEAVSLMHSTSWRVDYGRGPASADEGPNGHVVLTYIVVVDPPDLVAAVWPQAQPIGQQLLEAVGPAKAGPAVDAPVPRHVDVLVHGLRHLRFLLDNDHTVAATLGDTWRRHLAPLRPALAGMYTRSERPVDLN